MGTDFYIENAPEMNYSMVERGVMRVVVVVVGGGGGVVLQKKKKGRGLCENYDINKTRRRI